MDPVRICEAQIALRGDAASRFGVVSTIALGIAVAAFDGVGKSWGGVGELTVVACAAGGFAVYAALGAYRVFVERRRLRGVLARQLEHQPSPKRTWLTEQLYQEARRWHRLAFLHAVAAAGAGFHVIWRMSMEGWFRWRGLRTFGEALAVLAVVLLFAALIAWMFAASYLRRAAYVAVAEAQRAVRRATNLSPPTSLGSPASSEPLTTAAPADQLTVLGSLTVDQTLNGLVSQTVSEAPGANFLEPVRLAAVRLPQGAHRAAHVDGRLVQAGDRVLIVGDRFLSDGIYTVVMPPDVTSLQAPRLQHSQDLAVGDHVYVLEGAQYGDTLWAYASVDPGHPYVARLRVVLGRAAAREVFGAQEAVVGAGEVGAPPEVYESLEERVGRRGAAIHGRPTEEEEK